MLTGVLQLIFIQNNVKHIGWTLGELVSGHHLHGQVFGLRLSAGFYESRQYLFVLQFSALAYVVEL